MANGHVPLPPFAAYSGSRNPKMLIVGEAWGETEAQFKRPFVGASGQELMAMLGEAMPLESPELFAEMEKLFRYGQAWTKGQKAWLEAIGIGMTNVLALRPPGNDLEQLCIPKSELPEKGKNYAHHHLVRGKYLQPQYLGELQRLSEEVTTTRPNLILGLGNTACWACVGATNIGSIRGTVSTSAGAIPSGYKFLSSYHPAGVLRNWAWRPIVVADLMKAWREAQFPEIRRPARRVLVSPTLAEATQWVAETLANPPPLLAPDIETAKGQITCIGFARSRSEALVIPFWDRSAPGYQYWPSHSDELAAWELVSQLLASPIPKVTQNGMYDYSYLQRLGFTLNNCIEDSMLLHHSIFPEMKKGLGFLGSIYSNEASWKLMRLKKADTEKRDE